MKWNYDSAQKLCKNGLISSQYFVCLFSDEGRFICGDGYLDALTSALVNRGFGRRALVPLTPEICIYFSTTITMRSGRNCVIGIADNLDANEINKITQIYSGQRIFFRGAAPVITEHFKRGEFLEIVGHANNFVDNLDYIFRELNMRREL